MGVWVILFELHYHKHIIFTVEFVQNQFMQLWLGSWLLPFVNFL